MFSQTTLPLQPLYYHGRRFESLQDITTYIGALHVNEQYDAQADILEQLLATHSQVGDWVEAMFKYVKSNGAYYGRLSEDEFISKWQGVIVVIQDNKTRRDRLAEARANILKHWKSNTATEWITQLQASATFMAEVRRLSNRLSFTEAIMRVNESMVERLSRPGRGSSKCRVVTTRDITKAIMKGSSHLISTQVLRSLGLQVGRFGILEAASQRNSSSEPISITPGIDIDHGTSSNLPVPVPDIDIDHGTSSNLPVLVPGTDIDHDTSSKPPVPVLDIDIDHDTSSNLPAPASDIDIEHDTSSNLPAPAPDIDIEHDTSSNLPAPAPDIDIEHDTSSNLPVLVPGIDIEHDTSSNLPAPAPDIDIGHDTSSNLPAPAPDIDIEHDTSSNLPAPASDIDIGHDTSSNLPAPVPDIDIEHDTSSNLPVPVPDIDIDHDTSPNLPIPVRDIDIDPDTSSDLSSIDTDYDSNSELSEYQCSSNSSTYGTSESNSKQASTPSSSQKRCLCSSDVTRGWKDTVTQRRKKAKLSDSIDLLNAQQDFRKVCFVHLKAMGARLGLRIKMLNTAALRQRLRYIYRHQAAIEQLKVNQKTYQWFRMTDRPRRPSDDLGPYMIPPVLPSLFDYEQPAVLKSIAAIIGVPAAFISESWHTDGSVNLDLFSWWFQGPIGEIVLAEFELYRFHQREINGKSNLGWLRTMYHSIGQQLMRQDPVYYMLYAGLRPDKHWRLVSFPYYAKYARAGDSTRFRHLDLNVPRLLADDRGGAMIQGTLSLDNEDDNNCTVLIPGMHIQNRLALWWERCQARGQGKNGFVLAITGDMFTRDDAHVLGVDWKTVPCKRGEVRITVPHLPHGSTGPATTTRRTMLPWYVGVQDDEETLEVPEGGTWSDLSQAHRDLTTHRLTPSGLPIMQGAIPYRFPAAVELIGLSPISDALTCRRRWNSPLVLKDRDLLLGHDTATIISYVREWRARAEVATLTAFQAVIEAEKLAFQENSYFYHTQDMASLGPAGKVR